MTPAELRFWQLAQRRVAVMQPDVQAAVLRAFQILRDGLSDAELSQLIEAGQLDRLLTDVLDQSTLDRAFIPYRQQIRRVVDRGFTFATKDLPKGGTINGVIAVSFDHLSPAVITAIRTMETKALASLQADVREAVRVYVELGLREGKNARVIARSLRDVIGMSPTQTANAAKYAAKLASEDVPATKADRMIAAYQKRAIALNAETNARTATLDAYKEGQRLAWQQAIDSGVVDGNRLTKSWKGVLDARERPEHIAMQDEMVPFQSPFSNGEMVPGDSTYNCRCVAIYRVGRAA